MSVCIYLESLKPHLSSSILFYFFSVVATDQLRIFSHLKKLVKILRPDDMLRMVSSVPCGEEMFASHLPGKLEMEVSIHMLL